MVLVVVVEVVVPTVVLVVVVEGAPQWPTASHTPPAQGMPICSRAHVVVQQASAGSHSSPLPASTIPSPHRERAPVKRAGFFFGLVRTANVPVTRVQVAASISALRVALPERPVHADQVT